MTSSRRHFISSSPLMVALSRAGLIAEQVSQQTESGLHNDSQIEWY
jgi:hypothetical protein